MRCLASMRFNVLVTGALYSSQSSYSALLFCRAAFAAGHSISQVFFYQDGVGSANRFSTPLDDEFEPVEAWSQLAKDQEIELVVCVSAAERRGVMSDAQAIEFAIGEDSLKTANDTFKQFGNLHSSFSIAGLGALHEASLESDRTVTFK